MPDPAISAHFLSRQPSPIRRAQILFAEQDQLDLITGEQARQTPGMGRARDAGAAFGKLRREQFRNPLAERIGRRIRLVRADQKMLLPINRPLPIRRMPAG